MPMTDNGITEAMVNLVAFAEWAVREGPWEGCSLDGGEVQEKAVEFGILVKTKYDPEIHGESSEAERGDDWYVFSPAIAVQKGSGITEVMVEAAAKTFWEHPDQYGDERVPWDDLPAVAIKTVSGDIAGAVRNSMRAALQAAIAAQKVSHAGEGPGPSTLAANRTSSPSVSRRGEPAPDQKGEGVREADVWFQALMRYSGGFYSTAIERGMKADFAANAVAHIEKAARALHRLASPFPADWNEAVGAMKPFATDAQFMRDLKRYFHNSNQGIENRLDEYSEKIDRILTRSDPAPKKE